MKKLVFIAILVAVLVLFFASLFARDYEVQEKEEIQKTLRFADPAKPGQVIVDNLYGSIRVEGYNGRDVILVAHKAILARSKDRIDRAKEEVKLDIAEKGNTIDIYVDGPFRCNERRGYRSRRDPGYEVHYDFELKVPFKTELDLATVMNGAIEVKNVEGAFGISNVNGEIKMKDVAGSGDAHTVNGKVEAAFRRIPEGDCSFKTINGDLELQFPDNLAADFRLKTMNGEVYTDFSVASLPAKAAVIEEHKGKYVYRSNRFFGVRAGKGGPEIRMETLNGDMLIKKRTT